jgi:hypothetical protein
MALTGALQADFSDFVGEAQKASAALAVMEAEGKKTGTTLAKTGAVVDGFGSGAGANLTKLTGGLKSVDASLNAMGVSISKPIAALEEIGAASGKTAAELGTLGTAAAVAGAAFAGWNLGRWIADLTGSDEAIGNAVANMLGLRDAGQAAANNADVLNRAFQLTGKVFTDVHAASEAIRASLRQNAAQLTTTASKVTEWEQELGKAKGGVAALRGEIDAGNLTLDQMKTRFNVSAEAIDYLKRNMALAKEETEKLARADEAAAKAAQAHADARKKLQDSMFGTDQIAKANEAIEALGGMNNLTRMSTEEQTKLNKVVGEGIESLRRAGEVGTGAMNEIYIATLPLPPIVNGLGEEWNSVGEKVTANADKIIAKSKEMTDAEKAYHAETQRLADEWNKTQAATYGAKKAVDDTKESVKALTVEMQQFGRVNQSVWEDMASGMELMEAYSKAGVAMGTQTALGGYNFGQITAPGITPTSATAARSLTVTVNNAQAQDIAERLTTEMRHSGVRF